MLGGGGEQQPQPRVGDHGGRRLVELLAAAVGVAGDGSGNRPVWCRRRGEVRWSPFDALPLAAREALGRPHARHDEAPTEPLPRGGHDLLGELEGRHPHDDPVGRARPAASASQSHRLLVGW
uniref:Uncharacterized protein n=1 Tax=Janibacter limosus TaxID=53458 RepID=A0AC61U7E3_9MICO|nr:hypothetical protein [Janibacter limosus]